MKISIGFIFVMLAVQLQAQVHPSPDGDSKSYTRIVLTQYPGSVDLSEEAYLNKKPVRQFNWVGQRFNRVQTEKFERRDFNRLEIFKTQVGKDSFTIRMEYKKLILSEHENNFVHVHHHGGQYRIDNELIYGYVYRVEKDSAIIQAADPFYLESVVIKMNDKVVVNIPRMRPWFFNFHVGSFYKVLNEDLFFADFRSGEGGESFRGYYLFDTKGQMSCYADDTPDVFAPILPDLLSDNTNRLQYVTEYMGHASFNSYDALMYHLTFKGVYLDHEYEWRKYWQKNKEKHLAFCRSINLSSLIKSDSIYGEFGYFEKERPFLAYLYEVKKSATDPLLYHIKGVNKLGNNKCNFSGDLKIKHMLIQEPHENQKKKPFHISGDFIFRENPDQKGSGTFTGSVILSLEDHNDLLNNKPLNTAKCSRSFQSTYQLYNDKKIKFNYWGGEVNSGGTKYDGFETENIRWWKK